MILWTIMPEEIIFGPREPARRMVVSYRSRRVVCEAAPDGWRISALISTDPRDYLDARFQPGTLIASEEIDSLQP